LVTDIWKACQNNLGAFQSMFGGHFIIVDNTVYKPIGANLFVSGQMDKIFLLFKNGATIYANIFGEYTV
jgi:hypothetical protein